MALPDEQLVHPVFHKDLDKRNGLDLNLNAEEGSKDFGYTLYDVAYGRPIIAPAAGEIAFVEPDPRIYPYHDGPSQSKAADDADAAGDKGMWRVMIRDGLDHTMFHVIDGLAPLKVTKKSVSQGEPIGRVGIGIYNGFDVRYSVFITENGVTTAENPDNVGNEMGHGLIFYEPSMEISQPSAPVFAPPPVEEKKKINPLFIAAGLGAVWYYTMGPGKKGRK